MLDILFKPKFGASFQHLKVEIGGGENSTCGSEPSHAVKLPMPHTLFGDTEWNDTAIEAEVLVSGGHVAIGARYARRTKLGWHITLAHDGQWRLFRQDQERATGTLASLDAAKWHTLRLETHGTRIRAHINGTQVAEVTGSSSTKGMANLASSYHRNLIDQVRVMPPTAAKTGP